MTNGKTSVHLEPPPISMSDMPPLPPSVSFEKQVEQSFSHEAEQTVLSCILQDPRLLTDVKSSLPPECFYHFQTQIVYRTILRLVSLYQPIEFVSLTNYLRDNGQLDRAGGAAAISELYTFTFVTTAASFRYHTELLIEKHAQRQIIAAAGNIVDAIRAPLSSSGEVLEHAIAELQRLAQSRLNTADMLQCRPLKTILHDVFERAEERSNHPGMIPGISTGFATIDMWTGGMQDGRLWVIAGETSDGKSSLVQNFIESACDAGHTAAIYSYEMPDTECAERLLCSRGPVDAGDMMIGKYTHGSFDAVQRAQREIVGWKLSILDVDETTIEQICRDITLRVAALRKAEPDAKFVAAIDYLQLANTFQQFNNNRERAVAYISKTAKQCAKRNKVCILVPSQLNDDGKLRESRAIGHDADVALKIQKPKDAKKDDLSDRREIFCGKNRGGKRNWSAMVNLVGQNFKFTTL